MSASHSTALSQGMSGWSQVSQTSRRPSGLIRGAATKSGPVTSTAGSPTLSGPGVAARATISLRTAVTSSAPSVPGAGWDSRTQITVLPSGLSRPSA